MNYKTLNKKPTMLVKLKSDGSVIEIKDLLAKTCNREVWDSILTIVVVNKYYTARVDLISLAVYGTTDYADAICKFNNISNPFEVNENDMLLIPTLDYIDTAFKFPETVSALCTTKSTIQYTSTSSITKQVNEERATNEKTVNDFNYSINRELGIIFY